MTSAHMKRSARVALKVAVFLAGLMAVTNAFNLPAHNSPPIRQAVSTSTTAMGLQRPHRGMFQKLERTGKGAVVVNQSRSTLEEQGFVDDTAPADGDASPRTQADTPATKAATVTSSTMNLIKVILGTGSLALPNGLAAVSDYPKSLLPASALLTVLGLFSAYTFQLYGRLTHETQATSMGDVWEQTVGKKTSWIISASTFAYCFGCALTYSLVIGDFMSSLAMSISGMPALLATRQFWILAVTLSTLVPLSNLKSLTALAPMSFIGTVGTLLTTMFMALRCPAIFASSPYRVVAPMGRFAAAAVPALAPKFNTFSNLISPAALILASMATTAYLGHFNAPDLYNGFKRQKATNNDEVSTATDDNDKALQNYGRMASIAFAGVTVWNIIILALGFLTFGGNSAGIVLNNYATADKGAGMSRLLMTLSIIGGYPFMLRACKSTFVQLYSDFNKGMVASKSKLENQVGRALLAIVTSLSLLLSDAGLVVSLNGALMGSAIIYIFPGLMHLAHTGKRMKVAGCVVSKKLQLERWASRFLVTFGAASGLIGAAVTVINSCAPHLLR